MTFLLLTSYFRCRTWNPPKMGTRVLLIIENVLESFSIFCDFFGIRKYFLDSTNLNILKIEFYESGSGRKILEKLFLNSPYKRVPTNKFLDFSKLCLCFHRTFLKNIKKTLKYLDIHISWNPLEITCRCFGKLKLGSSGLCGMQYSFLIFLALVTKSFHNVFFVI